LLGSPTSASATIADNDPVPTSVTLTASDAGATEAAGNAGAYTLTRSTSTGSLTVALAWSGNATLGSDYTLTATGGTVAANGTTFTFSAGVTSATITLTPVDDTAVEGTETAHLALGTSSAYATGTPSSGTVTITDNDRPSLSVSNATVTIGKNSTTVTMTVTLSSAYNDPVTVTLSTADGTAKAGTDYTALTTTLTFLPGQTVKTVSITILGHNSAQSTKQFSVNLTSPTNATLGTATGTVTISWSKFAAWSRPLAPVGSAPSAPGGGHDTPVYLALLGLLALLGSVRRRTHG